MIQSSLATKSQSFDLVKSEIEQTIRNAETSLERFQENRESGEDLQNCVDYLNQLRGIFVLVELRGGTLLCKEAVTVANDVPVGASDDKNILLTTLNSALFILRRYVEYYHQQREDHPELLLPIINELKVARGEAPLPESHFFELDTEQRPDFCTGVAAEPVQLSDTEFEAYARRMRLMLQVALVGVIRERNEEVSKKLIARSSRGFARLCGEGQLKQLWCLLVVVAETMTDRAMGFNQARKRLLMRIEKYSRDIVYVGRTAARRTLDESVIRDLVYLLYRSGSANQEVQRILSAWKLAPSDYPESMMEAHRKRLYGPGADVLKSLSSALQDELNQLKDRLDIIERGIEPDLSELSTIADSLKRLANTLNMLDLNRLSDIARNEADRLLTWEQAGELPAEDELYTLADAVLGIESAVQQMVSRGITSETDALAIARPDTREGTLYLREAAIVVGDEAKSALTLAKRAITAFVESDYDKLHLANLPNTLHSIWGLMMIGDPDAADVMDRVARSIQTRLLDVKEPPGNAVLESLADALTSLEYYIENIGTRDSRNPDLLRLAETSLQDGGL